MIDFNDVDEQDDLMSEINMIPFIDVMLVLLIIFIIATPALTQSVTIDIPKAEEQSTTTPAKSYLVSLNQQGEIFWQDESVTSLELKQQFKKISINEPTAQIHLKSDENTPYKNVLRVMTQASAAGVTQLGFVYEQDFK